MGSTHQTFNYAMWTDGDIVDFGLNQGQDYFTSLWQGGALNNDSLYIRVGEIVNHTFREMGVRSLGPNGAEFAKNISEQDGKIRTVVDYGTDSIVAARYFGGRIPDGPLRWTGGVYHVAFVEINGEWRERTFAGAASGVQGHFDMATTYVVLTSMGAAWALQQKALASPT